MASVISCSLFVVALYLLMVLPCHNSTHPFLPACCSFQNSKSVYCWKMLWLTSSQGSHWFLMSLPTPCACHSSSVSHQAVSRKLRLHLCMCVYNVCEVSMIWAGIILISTLIVQAVWIIMLIIQCSVVGSVLDLSDITEKLPDTFKVGFQLICTTTFWDWTCY